jgi:hypothetical protein
MRGCQKVDTCRGVIQLVEALVHTQRAAGSSPAPATKKHDIKVAQCTMNVPLKPLIVG